MIEFVGGLLSAILLLQLFVVVSTPKVLIGPQGPQGLAGASADVTTNWTAGAFSSDLSVGGDLTVTGTTTLGGIVSGIPKVVSTTMSSSATTTACTSLNSSGVDRVVLAATVVDRGTAASVGSVTWTAGTSTYSGANGSSAVAYTKVVNTYLTRISGVDVLTTTSTLLGTSGAYSDWPTGSYFNFISGTTTNAGTCRIVYF